MVSVSSLHSFAEHVSDEILLAFTNSLVRPGSPVEDDSRRALDERPEDHLLNAPCPLNWADGLRVSVADDSGLNVARHARAAQRSGCRRRGLGWRRSWRAYRCGRGSRRGRPDRWRRRNRHDRRFGRAAASASGRRMSGSGLSRESGLGLGSRLYEWRKRRKSDPRRPRVVPVGRRRISGEQGHGTNGEQQSGKQHGSEREQSLAAPASRFGDISPSVCDPGASTGRRWKPKTALRAIRRVFRIARSAVRTVQIVTLCRTSTEYRFGVRRSSLQSVSSG